jgi:hypothetical protein
MQTSKGRKKIIKMIGIILVIAIMMGITLNHGNFKIHAEETKVSNSEEWEQKQLLNHEVVNEDGNINMTFYFTDGTRKVSVYENGILTNWYYNENDEEIHCDQLDVDQMLKDVEQDTAELENLEDEDDDYDIEVDSSELKENTRGGNKKIKWTKTVKENLRNIMWFKTSTNTKTSWIKIGAKAKYVINCSKLTANQWSEVEAYKTNIREVRATMQELDKSIDDSCFEKGAFICVLIAALVAGATATVIAGILTTAFGFDKDSYTVHTQLGMQAKKYYDAAHEKYLRIRNYGNVYK